MMEKISILEVEGTISSNLIIKGKGIIKDDDDIDVKTLWEITLEVKQNNTFTEFNEGFFSVIIENNKICQIKTVFESNKDDESESINFDDFDYIFYNIPPIVWICINGCLKSNI